MKQAGRSTRFQWCRQRRPHLCCRFLPLLYMNQVPERAIFLEKDCNQKLSSQRNLTGSGERMQNKLKYKFPAPIYARISWNIKKVFLIHMWIISYLPSLKAMETLPLFISNYICILCRFIWNKLFFKTKTSC